MAETIDVAVLILSQPEHPGLELLPIAHDSMALMVAEGDPLADRAEVRLRDLVDRDFVDGPLGWGSRTIVDREFARERLKRRVVVEVGDPSVQLGYVRAGLGVAFMVQSIVPTGSGMQAVKVVDADPQWHAVLALKRGRRQGAAVTRLVTLLIERAAALQWPRDVD